MCVCVCVCVLKEWIQLFPFQLQGPDKKVHQGGH